MCVRWGTCDLPEQERKPRPAALECELCKSVIGHEGLDTPLLQSYHRRHEEFANRVCYILWRDSVVWSLHPSLDGLKGAETWAAKLNRGHMVEWIRSAGANDQFRADGVAHIMTSSGFEQETRLAITAFDLDECRVVLN
jgi:hypothetical protein